MYRIRLHGRGGQGIVTAARILGTALFREGFEVQDAPRYGAERRGAPLFAAVRAARGPIHERGVVRHPDLVVVVDETLVAVAAAGVMEGLAEHTLLLVRSDESEAVWRERLRPPGPLAVLPAGSDGAAGSGTACAAAAARCLGVVDQARFEAALREELRDQPGRAVDDSLRAARGAWEAMADRAGCVVEGPDSGPATPARPDWVDLPLDDVAIAAPDVHGAATSVQVRTGLWRTVRPVVDRDLCRRCHWVCGTFCPDGAIAPDADGFPVVDLDHCKGCGVCAAVCPSHAILTVPEREARAREDAP